MTDLTRAISRITHNTVTTTAAANTPAAHPGMPSSVCGSGIVLPVPATVTRSIQRIKYTYTLSILTRYYSPISSSSQLTTQNNYLQLLIFAPFVRVLCQWRCH